MSPDPDGFHVFVSYASDDRSAVRPMVEALRRTRVHGRRMRVFLEERSTGDHESITGTITEGVLKSTALLAYCSRTYASRHACQHELTLAFLLAQRAGTVEGRILVVNPEEGSGHIEPVELRDLKHRTRPATCGGSPRTSPRGWRDCPAP
ncbi:hypothetical protein PS9374_02340 [Planomonospora sphaerica]|uniref:TIR domain-containing protein n=1 Tax=Planomonospora sphaerica TaxID=161355 RepID=A0A171CH11_9ACTN|nr:toll/interleukin-1 receptor domain-containing protein [Planomonospora sphaerica]GAT66690.1 hypothetical protein PS9374_02340 [Planomonospora sphaerica]